MKVAVLSTLDYSGGAARAAYRLHQGLQHIGVESWMLVQSKGTDDPRVLAPPGQLQRGLARLKRYAEALPLRRYPNCQPDLFSPAWLPDRLETRLRDLAPDLIHLHWVGWGFLQVETLTRLSQPLVWTLDDMWAFTGGCHYSGACDRYQKACGACPHLGSQTEPDLSRTVWQRKQRAWRSRPITIVTPSHWLADCARSSSLLGQQRIEVIPYGLDIQRYKPIPRPLARQILNLPQDSKLILFGAISATADPRKGFQFLPPALNHLRQTGWNEPTELVVFGASQPEHPPNLGFPVHYLGHLYDDFSLALLYSAADVMIVPSIQEALGQTASEALACGTPVVAFDVTGLKDVVDHQQTGYLAVPFDSADLARGIAWVLDPAHHPRLCAQSRAKAEQEYSLERQAERYQALYTQMLQP